MAAAQLDPVVFPTPDLAKSPAGPDWIVIGNEGGFLPAPVVVDGQQVTAVGGEYNTATLLNVDTTEGYGFEADIEYVRFNQPTVNDPAMIAGLIAMGVDGIITDRPDLLRHALAERSASRPTLTHWK